MQAGDNTVYPRARTHGLIVRELADEIVIYDTAADKAHCLNPTAAFVWKHADGSRTPDGIARLLAVETDSPVNENLVWYALGELHKDNLLDEQTDATDAPTSSVSDERISRRNMLKLAGAAAAIPVVASIAASPAYAAGSCNYPCLGSKDTKSCTSIWCRNCKPAMGKAAGWTCQH